MTEKTKINVMSYIRPEKLILCVIAASGVVYNIGMTAGPWFEGKLAQYLCDIINGYRTFSDMVLLALLYVFVIAVVQGMRFIKRLYVRKFANNINREMKEDIYHSMISKSQAQLEQEGVGALMTKAVADVDACAEGIRKFVTEIFDTGVVMVSYLIMLLVYDWRLTLMSMVFPPVAYIFADRLKKVVTQSAQVYKESAGRLNAATYDRVKNAVTYRIYGREDGREELYEQCLADYERKAVRANIWENSMQPIYQVISMLGAVCILWFGGKNVLGEGWISWDIAAFVTFLSCFTKLAAKSSKAAKLFNAVQKAEVSWTRIRPLLADGMDCIDTAQNSCGDACDSRNSCADENVFIAENVSFGYDGEHRIVSDVSFSGRRGEIIGITGPVACGKSTLGRLFLGDYNYNGSIRINGSAVYMGHEPELIGGTIEDNILLGLKEDAWKALEWVRMDEEVKQMPEGIHTRVGNGGVTLSGGQQARIALARTLMHKKELIILDDPFSAVDMKTEQEIYANIQAVAEDCTVLIFSHRLAMFPEMSRIFRMDDGRLTEVTDEA